MHVICCIGSAMSRKRTWEATRQKLELLVLMETLGDVYSASICLPRIHSLHEEERKKTSTKNLPWKSVTFLLMGCSTFSKAWGCLENICARFVSVGSTPMS